MKSVEKDLSNISAERTQFRALNSDRLPEEAIQTHFVFVEALKS
jgi:hypothetical protein